MTVFFDTHGGAWTTCSPEHPEAQAFGPCGAARELGAEEVALLGLSCPGITPHTAAARLGRLEVAPEGWDILLTPEEVQA